MAATATLTSATSLEGQAAEVMRELVQAEDAWVAAGLALTPPVTRQRRVTVTPSIVNGVITYNFSLPISVADAANGFSVAVQTYLP